MDQRARERLPALPTLRAAVGEARTATAALLTRRDGDHAPGGTFTVDGRTLHRVAGTRFPANLWAQDPVSGGRRNLTREAERAFCAWAAMHVLPPPGGGLVAMTDLVVRMWCELDGRWAW